MKIKDIREKTNAELDNLLAELLKEKLNLAIQARTGQLENTARVKSTRKDIAKVMTEMSARKAGNS
ncbi:MAG: 50S ribosomal protein L29 [Victivallaceae bacterium]|nr:50S ribosomal protein L29 [Victivallaceae bacterium]